MITAAILICLAPVAYDGDTLRCGRSPARVRLFGIEAPEIGTAGAPEAKVALQLLVVGGLICEPLGANYTRTVALCRDFTGRDVAKTLLDATLVKEWCRYSVSRNYPRGYYGTCPAAP